MSYKVRILDGGGTDREAVLLDDAITVSSSGQVPFGFPQIVSPLRQYLTDDGLITGSNDMKVDGSVTNVDFSIAAHEDYDTYVTNLSIQLTAGIPKYGQFGSGLPLTNGIEVFYLSEKTGKTLLHNSIKTNFDFIRFMQQTPAFGEGTNAFILTNVEGADEGFLFQLNLSLILPPNGIRLQRGTNQTFTIRIKDDTSGVGSFNAIVNGFLRLPE